MEGNKNYVIDIHNYAIKYHPKRKEFHDFIEINGGQTFNGVFIYSNKNNKFFFLYTLQ